jgi:hypothetical protein
MHEATDCSKDCWSMLSIVLTFGKRSRKILRRIRAIEQGYRKDDRESRSERTPEHCAYLPFHRQTQSLLFPACSGLSVVTPAGPTRAERRARSEVKCTSQDEG